MTTDAQQSGSESPAGNEAQTPEAAQARIAELNQDRSYMDAYLAGERGKVDEMKRLYGAAYPEPGDDTAPPADAVQADDWLARPSGANAYDFSPLLDTAIEEPPEMAAARSEISEALYVEGLPAFAVDAAVNVMARQLKQGVPDDEALERSKLEGMAALELRHGTASKDILAAARKMFERLEQRDQRIGDLLCASGAGNDPYLIETAARLWTEKYSKGR